jgi:hypothetical protein
MDASLKYLYTAYHWPAVASAALICAICLLFPRIRHRAQISRLPLLNGSASSEEQRRAYLESAHRLYLEGYKQVRTIAQTTKYLWFCGADGIRSSQMTPTACQSQTVCIPAPWSIRVAQASNAEQDVSGQENIVIPPRLMPEVRTLSDSVVSFYPEAAKVGDAVASQSQSHAVPPS